MRPSCCEVIAGRDPMDSTSADVSGARLRGGTGEAGARSEGRHRQGIFWRRLGHGGSERSRSRNPKLAGLGCEIVPVSLPHTKYAIPMYYIVATAEASANLARFDGVRYGFRARDAHTSIRDVPAQPRSRIWRGGEAPHHAGYLCVQRRILRCILSESAEGPHPAGAGF